MSEGGVGLAAVIGQHVPRDRYDDDGGPVGTECTCGGWTGDYFAEGEAGPFDQHLADVVLDHLAAKASEAAVVEAVAEAVLMHAEPVCDCDDCRRITATAALTAFLGVLGGSVGPAGVEAARGATDEVLGRQKGGNACRSRMSRDREAEPCSKAEGHIGQHANSYCVWSDK